MSKLLHSLKSVSRKFPRLTTMTVAFLAATSPAMAFEGGWKFQGSMLLLGDNSDNTGLLLSNSPRYCGRTASRGSASIRQMLVDGNSWNGGQITWYIDHECDDGYKRVCITNSYGSRGCNTYRDHGWVDF